MSNSVQVVVRFRPLNETEREKGPDSCVTLNNDRNEVVVLDRDGPGAASASAAAASSAASLAQDLALQKSFTYDGVFGALATQEEIFKAIGLPVVNNVRSGYHGTVLAYGQTGSGKSHSMSGPGGGAPDALLAASPHYAQRGLVPRIVEELFRQLDQLPAAEVTWRVSVSVFELYREVVQDLLSDAAATVEYRIREDVVGGRGVYVENLFAKPCTSASEVLEALRVSLTKRRVGATKANDTSSRSHCVTLLTLEQVDHLRDDAVTTSRLTLVDLAGSERQSKTGATGDVLKEGASINLSLTSLGVVIQKLTDGKGGFVPYRNSKLTLILRDSFGGNSVTTMLCHCSPSTYNREETLGTLRFAARAKFIRNKPRVNRELSQKELQLQLAQALDRIRMLEERLAIHGISGGGGGSGSGGGGPTTGAPSGVDSPSKRMAAAAAASASAAAAAAASDGSVPVDEQGLRELVESLLSQVEDLKRDLFQKEDELAGTTRQVEFYKAKAAEAESDARDIVALSKKELAVLQRRLADAEAAVALGKQQIASAAAVAESAPGLTDVPGGARDVSGAGKRAAALRRTTSDARGRGGGGALAAAASASASMRRGSAGLQQPVETLSVVGSTPRAASAATTAIAPMETLSAPETLVATSRADAAVMATIEDAEAAALARAVDELRLRAAELEAQLKQQAAAGAAVAAKRKEADAAVTRLSDALEAATNAQGDLQQELEALRLLLESKNRENDAMRRVLEELDVNWKSRLDAEQRRALSLQEETTGLRATNEGLRQTAEQQEFAELAAMELLIKNEDMDAVERDMMNMTTFSREADFLAARERALGVLRELAAFLSGLTDKLVRSRFNTGTLESRRIGLINDAAAMTARCDEARALLKG